ncbi:hypothetical protein [Pseudooceanicola algae]|uniref:Uncharacterized protein n=1 Tax=Pseudooceanicola algae TaxID=1537215 RepID=A0A418SDC5_9RHOB|nr:hypothetical protein [Pseudooceanicola algae]QPM89358.1 hypothetical protein PSAL_005740 [Pseudooceanicola algae]
MTFRSPQEHLNARDMRRDRLPTTRLVIAILGVVLVTLLLVMRAVLMAEAGL